MQDINAIDKAMETMNTAWQAASQDIYQGSQNGGAEGGAPDFGAGAPNEGNNANDDVTDVEFEEVGEDKK